MPVSPPEFVADDEPTYTRSVFEAILAGMGPIDTYKNEYVCSDDGARVKHPEADGSLAWHPWCEVTTPGSPNPLDEPWLRFPFTARRLAALLIDGWGYFIRERYGDWESGPDEDELLRIGPLGGKAKEALRAAYEACRHAVEMAHALDPALEANARELAQRYTAAREAAMAKEELRRHRDSDAEYTVRLEKVNAAVADLGNAMEEARRAADQAHSSWRQAVVQHLLLPIDEVPAESFRSLTLRALPPDRRAEALHQLRAQKAFDDSDVGKAHWDLMRERRRVEAEMRRWRLLQPTSVTEAVLHDAKLKELDAEWTAISDRMRSFEGEPATQLGSVTAGLKGSADEHLDYARLATRDRLLHAFGSFGLRPDWFDDLKSHQWLLDARKVKGQGQRGRRCDPLFCPYEVMVGLAKKSRKGRLRDETGWRILEHSFPAAYTAVSAGDPRDPSG